MNERRQRQQDRRVKDRELRNTRRDQRRRKGKARYFGEYTLEELAAMTTATVSR